MTTESIRAEFVRSLSEVAIDAVVLGELENMREPPGRQPAPDVLARSEWFRSMAALDQAATADVMREVALGAVHAVLSVLDGVASLDDAGTVTAFRLVWDRPAGPVDLTDNENGADLHDLLSEVSGD